VEYTQAWQLQDSLAAEIAEGRQPPTLLLLEHPHTYTFGRRGHVENLLWDEAELARRGVTVAWVDRGGDVTYHGPGQLVGYPLLPLGAVRPSPDRGRLLQADYTGYLRRLEQVLILALARLGVSARQVEGLTGVWVDHPLQVAPRCDHDLVGQTMAAGSQIGRRFKETPNHSRISLLESRNLAKIAAIGVKVDARGVTRHGFALNVNPDMSYWDGIVACGLAGYPVTSLAELLGEAPPMDQVAGEVMRAFAQVFDYEPFD
jgi:lipoate-protein ligase B